MNERSATTATMTSERPSGAAAAPRHTLVLLCRDLQWLGYGLDLAEIARWVRETQPSVEVETVEGLCRRPRAVQQAGAVGAERLVLGLCSAETPDLERQFHARKAGLDPLGLGSVDLGGPCVRASSKRHAIGVAQMLLAAAVARAQAFPGSRPESVKPYLAREHQRVSRRALFTMPPIGYQAVAAIEADACVSAQGCDLCARVCPRNALGKIDGRMTVEKRACDACGLCVPQCPRGAIGLPSSSLGEIEAELGALLGSSALPAEEPRGILFVCAEQARTLETPGGDGARGAGTWLPLRVPCAGMVSPTWILQSLAGGAAAVGIVNCGETCLRSQRERVAGTVAYCREIAQALGRGPDAVRLLTGPANGALRAEWPKPLNGAARGRPAAAAITFEGPQAAAAALQRLAGEAEISPALVLAHPLSPLGLAEIDPDACTGCGTCARVCPTEALEFREGGGAVTVTLDATRCTGCGLCERWCPETERQAIRAWRVTDLPALERGPTILYEDRVVACEICGRSVGPAAMVERVTAMLGDDMNRATLAAITRRCAACRGGGFLPRA